MNDNYDKWNTIKKETNKEKKYRIFKEKEIFYLKMGENIGFEQNGKGEDFVRPIIILKKFNKDMFFLENHYQVKLKMVFFIINLALKDLIT